MAPSVAHYDTATFTGTPRTVYWRQALKGRTAHVYVDTIHQMEVHPQLTAARRARNAFNKALFTPKLLDSIKRMDEIYDREKDSVSRDAAIIGVGFTRIDPKQIFKAPE